MKRTANAIFSPVLLTIAVSSGFLQTETWAESKTLRGWLTDEACARGRAAGGKYTGGNPECARKCVAEGKKIVLALPEEKKLLVVANRETAKSNVGNYVEVTGNVDGETVQISSLTMLREGVAMCAAPRKKN